MTEYTVTHTALWTDGFKDYTSGHTIRINDEGYPLDTIRAHSQNVLLEGVIATIDSFGDEASRAALKSTFQLKEEAFQIMFGGYGAD